MNEQLVRSLTFCLALLGSTLLGQSTPTNPPAPSGKIEFAEPIFDFGRIRSGSIVNHDYIFTNTGSGTLTITHVQPSCGCTAATDWTRQVEPGSTGKIPVQFNSHNFNGQVLKTITVTSSAGAQPVVLQLKGEIWKPIDVSPQFAVINVLPDAASGSTTVRIINNTEETVSFSEPQVSNKSFAASIEPSTNNPAKEHVMRIRTVPPLPQGSVQSVITVKTSSTNAPVITVTAWANVQPAFVVMPGQITLPSAPLQGPVTPSILVQNNSTNSLQITEPAINVDNVKIDIRETQPGRQFAIALTFPKGYEIPAGEKVLFTAKSSNPSIPMIKVPVAQIPRIVAAPGSVPAPAPPKATPSGAAPGPGPGPVTLLPRPHTALQPPPMPVGTH